MTGDNAHQDVAICNLSHPVGFLPPSTPTVRQRCVMFVDNEPSANPRKQKIPPAVTTFLHVNRSHKAPTTGAETKQAGVSGFNKAP